MAQDPKKNARTVFHGIRFDVLSLEVPAPSGKLFKKEFIAHPGAVVIVPILDNANVLLIRNRRFAVDEYLLELPAGTREEGEQDELTAARELEEETGYRAQKIVPLTTFYTSPGITNETMGAFLATGLVKTKQNLDESEEIEVESYPMKKALEMVKDKKIKDGKTIAALLFYHAFYERL